MFEINKKRKTERDEMDGSRDQARMETHSSPTQTTPAPSRTESRSGPSDAAVIGKSIQIEGDVRGNEDLLIKGEVKGTIHLPNNNVTIGSEGKVHADVHAKSVCVDGVVNGNLFGSDRVSVRSSAQVSGNISSPRVSLDDGAHFKGSIEMDVEAPREKGSVQASAKSSSSSASKANGESPVTAPKSASDEAPRAGA
jgi:cytoskeletal protein CcmA (bactofilin family)